MSDRPAELPGLPPSNPGPEMPSPTSPGPEMPPTVTPGPDIPPLNPPGPEMPAPVARLI